MFEVISSESNSYYTTLLDILVPVGAEDVNLPARPPRLRTAGESKVALSKQPHEAATDQREREQGEKSIQMLALEIQEFIRVAEMAATRLADLEADRALENSRIDDLRDFYRQRRTCAGVSVSTQDMPKALRDRIAPHANPKLHVRSEGQTSGRAQKKDGSGGSGSAQQRHRSRSPQRRTRS